MTDQWYENFFYGIANDLWRQCVSQEQTEYEVDFILEATGCQAPAKVLDIPCGNGRHSLELASRGYAVTGLDISQESIDEARQASLGKACDVEWVCDDMRRLTRSEEFDAAFSFGNSFGYLEHSDTVEFLNALAKTLKPHGRFVLNSGAIAECLLPNYQEREWYQVGDILFAIENHYRVETSCIETKFVFVREGKLETRHGRQYVYTLAEITRMLAGAGLKTLELFRSTDRQPYELGGEQLFLVAEKDGT